MIVGHLCPEMYPTTKMAKFDQNNFAMSFCKSSCKPNKVSRFDGFEQFDECDEFDLIS